MVSNTRSLVQSSLPFTIKKKGWSLLNWELELQETEIGDSETKESNKNEA